MEATDTHFYPIEKMYYKYWDLILRFFLFILLNILQWGHPSCNVYAFQSRQPTINYPQKYKKKNKKSPT